MSKYEVVLSRRYKTTLKRLSRHKNFDREILEQVIGILERGGKLPASYHDHQLSGELREYRECHIKNDILLVYQKHDDILILLLVEIGTHSTIFK